jgi:hypothetical protein
MPYADMAERLWLNSGEPDDGSQCRLWLGRCTRKGYGRITYRVKGKRSPVSDWVHRVSYRVFKGPIPPGMEVDHVCERENCIAPWHLELVTGLENIALRGQRNAARAIN